MSTLNRFLLVRHLFTLAVIAAATLLRFALDPVLGFQVPFILYFPAIVLCAWFGGLWQGVLATALGGITAWYVFFPPRFSLEVSDPTAPVQVIIFSVSGVLISALAESLHRARRKTEESEAREREQRERLRVTVASIGDAVIATDAEGRVTLMNSLAEAMTGWKQSDAAGRPLGEVFRIVNEQTRLPVENPALRAISEGLVFGLANHTVLLTKSGAEIPIDDSGAPMRDSEGRTIGAVLIFRDISERRKADQARALLAAIVESSEDAVIGMGLDGVVSSWNAAAERIFGYAPGEMIGRPITTIIPPDRHEEGTRILQRVRSGERVEHFETVRLTKRGEPRNISFTVSPIRDAAGRIVGCSKSARDITERVRGARELDESRERLRLAMEASQMGTWTRELDESNRVRWSPELEWIFGLKSGEFSETEEEFFDYVHPEDRDAVRKAVGDAIANRTEYTVEFRYARKGEAAATRWMSGRGRAFYDAAGKPVRLAGFGWDITARKETEEALRHQREWLRVTLSSIGDAVITTDTNGRVTFLNPVAESLTGWSQDHARGEPLEKVFKIVNEQTRHAVENPALRAMRQGTIVGLANHTVLVTRGGAEIPIDDSGAPIKSDDGAILGAVLIFRDITERRSAEERFRLAVESAPNSMVMVDEEGRIVLVNSQTERLFGYARDELIGKPVEMLVPERFRRAHGGYRASFAEAPETRAMGMGRELFGVRKDGREVPVEIGLNPIRVRGKTLVLSSIVDISARKQAEQERAALLASERTAREHAEAASRSKDEFVAMLSHELRSPLSSILGWIQLLRTGKLDPSESARAVETIERSARMQAQLVEDLLDVSRAVTGKLILAMRPVEIGQVVEAALDSVRAAANAKSIQLDVRHEQALSRVSGDPARLQQVVWNLLSNAVKFTPRDGRVELRVGSDDSHLQIVVSDSGMGISPEFLPYVFDRFSQADTTSERKHSGLGLGLAIVRHLVELHGGTVRAESAGEGHGATFTLALPLIALKEEPAEFRARVADVERFTAPDALRGVRVMLVDDEPDARELLTRMLAGYGADVRACSSAAEALDVIDQWRPSVLVSDIGMPSGDGYSLIRVLRTLDPDRGGDIPAVALTAYAQSEDRTRALAAGFQMHVPKPVEPLELAMAIASLTGRMRQPASGSGESGPPRKAGEPE